MAKKVYDTDGLNMREANWDGDETTGGLPVSGRLVEQYIKAVDDKTETTTEIVNGETKPAQAGAVAAELTGVVTDVDVVDSSDGTEYVMTVKKKDGKGGETSNEVRFSKYTDDNKVVVNIDLTDSSGHELPALQYLSLGSGLSVRYAVSVGTAGGGEASGWSNLQARVIIKRGSMVMSAFQNAEFVNVSAGQSYTFDASPYLTDASSYTIQVEARADYEGGTLNRIATARVTMVAMELTTTFNVGNGVAEGGYRNDVNIPFTMRGTTGEKNIYYRVNGGGELVMAMGAGSGMQSRNLLLPLSSLTAGRNVVEAYALHEDSGVRSKVYYITVLKASDSVRYYAGLMFSHESEGFQQNWRTPVLNAEQFTAWSFDYTGYDVENNRATVVVSGGGAVIKEDVLLRGSYGSYGKTNVSTDTETFSVASGSAKLELKVETSGHGDIEATLSPDAVCSFDAYGRSNSESNAAMWKNGEYAMQFENVLWQVNENGAGSGWHNNRLLLSNGASMRLTKEGGHYYPFNEDEKPVGQKIADVGMTIEIEFSTANVTDTEAELIKCLGTLPNGNRYGLVVTPEEVKFLTGVVTEAVDAGEIIRYEDSVGTKFEPNTNIKIAYTFYPNVSSNEQRTLIGFYVDGTESAASRWTGKVNFDIDSEIEFNSVGADLLVKNVRIYNKALTDDESLNNYIVDRNHLEDTADEKGVRTLDEANRVLDESGNVSLQKLLTLQPKRKNSALIFIGTGSVESEVPSGSDTMNVLDALAQLNNKKANKLVKKIIFYNGEYPEQSFVAENVFVRIQGTSSVNYSRKNWRIYFQKTASGWTAILSYGEIDSNGEQKNPVRTEGKKNLFKLRPNSVGVKLACPKCDFSDSSMTTNTGGAKFFTDGMKEMGLLTPAQQYAQDHNLDTDYRASIDGMPCDLFAAKSEDEDLTYYGQYNMNNDKSDSYPIFGQDKTIGDEPWGEGDTLNYLTADENGKKEYLPIAIETLNNSNPCCLFQWVPSTDASHTAFMDKYFDGGLELNHPKDTFWNSGGGDADEEPNMKEHLGTGDKYDKMYKSIDRMMSFLNKCVGETEAGKNMSYNPVTGMFERVDYEDDGDKFPAAKWKSAYFRQHAREYFNVEFCLAYHMFVDFNLGVDQLAKNILWRCWDGRIWYSTWYDGDCQHGNDNKSMLSGKYDDNRQTKRDGAYVMQGHDSWMWNLLLANFADVRETLMTTGVNGGASFRSAFSVQKALNYFDKEQMERWCERLYNKSGIFKYVYPFLNALPVGSNGTMQTYPQIYGMKGNLKAHRDYFVRRRYDLKQVEYGYIGTNGAQFYQSTSSQNAGHVLSPLNFALAIPYRVQLSTSNGVQADSGVVAANTEHTLTLTGAFGENDPLKIIGAEKIKELVWHEDAFALGFNFGLFTSLVKLDMSVTAASQYRNASFMTGTETMVLLEEIVMTNNRIARNGDSGNAATLDLSFQSRLKRVLLKGTGIERLTLATGAPVEELALPGTLTELFLENLTRLTDGGLSLESLNNIQGYRFKNCPGIDGLALLERLHAAKTAGTGRLVRFSISVDMEDDGTILAKYSDYKTYTEGGANDNQHSGLKGRMRMTRHLSDEEFVRFEGIYPELEIVQPEYTMLEIDDSVADDVKVSNLDNKTGYKYGTDYVPSGHVSVILCRRHRVLAKVTKRATSLPVTMAGVDTVMNDTDGEMTYYPLDDTDSTRYADGSTAKLDGTEGDWMMREPGYWHKGVNDILKNKKYSCYSSRAADNAPASPNATVIRLDDIKATSGGYQNGRKIMVGKDTLASSYSADSGYSVCRVEVEGRRRVRFPSVPGTGQAGAVFADASGNIVGSVIVPVIGCKLEAGMYVISDVPEGAVTLYFSIQNSAEFDMVVLSDSERIEDMEPEWVYSEEFLCAVAGSSIVGEKLRSCVTGGSTAASMSWTDFHYYSAQRGMQQIDPMMHSHIANLSYARYGRLNMQEQCGAGQHTNNRKTGGSAKYGMQDTIGYDAARTVDPNVTNSMVDGLVHQYAWYRLKDSEGKVTVVQVNNICCLGYEDIYGNKYDMMDRVDVPNNSGNTGKWRIWMPDGSIRWVKGTTAGGNWITAVAHGKYMDVISVGTLNGSSSTYYSDIYYFNSATGRVVYRGNNNANANGGVSCANEVRCVECEHVCRVASGLPRQNRESGQRCGVQVGSRGGVKRERSDKA